MNRRKQTKKTPLLEEAQKSDESKKGTVEKTPLLQEAEKSDESTQRTVEKTPPLQEGEKSDESTQRTVEKTPLLQETGKSDESKPRTVKELELQDDEQERKGLIEKGLNQTLASTAHLANLLPTGTVLAFQVLCPIVSNSGHCDHVSSVMTECLLVLCALSCFFVSFTDSFRGSDGKLHYGLATPKGLWTFENLKDVIPDGDRYKVQFLDFVHAFLSVLVFAAIALLDEKVVRCLYPAPKHDTKEVLDVLPVCIGFFCSLLFVVFPTTRHGIGYPVASHY